MEGQQIVRVRRQWNDWKIADVYFQSLRDFHWSSVSGGINASSPKPMLCARMLCTEIVAGELSHSCRHGPPPHEIIICITQKDNGKELHKELAALATR